MGRCVLLVRVGSCGLRRTISEHASFRALVALCQPASSRSALPAKEWVTAHMDLAGVAVESGHLTGRLRFLRKDHTEIYQNHPCLRLDLYTLPGHGLEARAYVNYDMDDEEDYDWLDRPGNLSNWSPEDWHTEVEDVTSVSVILNWKGTEHVFIEIEKPKVSESGEPWKQLEWLKYLRTLNMGFSIDVDSESLHFIVAIPCHILPAVLGLPCPRIPSSE